MDVPQAKIVTLTPPQLAVFVLVGVALAVLLPTPWWAAPYFGLLSAAPLVAVAARRLHQNRLPPRPLEPVARLPHMRFPSPEPARTVLEPSDRCEICHRVLTNPDSQLKRVGMECIKTHGPRYKHVPNPAQAWWRGEMARAEANLAVERAEARVEHERDMAVYYLEVDEWIEVLESPESMERAANRGAAHALLAQATRGGTLATLAFGLSSLFV